MVNHKQMKSAHSTDWYSLTVVQKKNMKLNSKLSAGLFPKNRYIYTQYIPVIRNEETGWTNDSNPNWSCCRYHHAPAHKTEFVFYNHWHQPPARASAWLRTNVIASSAASGGYFQRRNKRCTRFHIRALTLSRFSRSGNWLYHPADTFKFLNNS